MPARYINSTKKQRDKLYLCHNGVGFLMYKKGIDTICQTEFFIKNGVPCYLENGRPVEFEVMAEEEE